MCKDNIVYSTHPENGLNDAFFRKQILQEHLEKHNSCGAASISVCRRPDGSIHDTYRTEREANAQASVVLLMHRTQCNTYRCNKCGGWHLCPGDRKPCKACNKMSYKSDSAARKQAKAIHTSRGISLQTYKCPHGEGVHLTSSP